MWVWMRIENYVHCCCCCFWVFFSHSKKRKNLVSLTPIVYCAHPSDSFGKIEERSWFHTQSSQSHKKQKLSKRGWDEFLEFQRIVRRRIRVRRKERRNLPNPQWERSQERRTLEFRTYVFFYWISHSHVFNKIDIKPTYMHKYSSSLSLVAHSLLHMLIQVISHTHVTLEPQDVGNLVSISSCRIGIE